MLDGSSDGFAAGWLARGRPMERGGQESSQAASSGIGSTNAGAAVSADEQCRNEGAEAEQGAGEQQLRGARGTYEELNLEERPELRPEGLWTCACCHLEEGMPIWLLSEEDYCNNNFATQAEPDVHFRDRWTAPTEPRIWVRCPRCHRQPLCRRCRWWAFDECCCRCGCAIVEMEMHPLHPHDPESDDSEAASSSGTARPTKRGRTSEAAASSGAAGRGAE